MFEHGDLTADVRELVDDDGVSRRCLSGAFDSQTRAFGARAGRIKISRRDENHRGTNEESRVALLVQLGGLLSLHRSLPRLRGQQRQRVVNAEIWIPWKPRNSTRGKGKALRAGSF